MSIHWLLVFLLVFVASAHAENDPLALQDAFLGHLASYAAASTSGEIEARVQLNTRLEDGDSDDPRLREGQVLLTLSDGPAGLALGYSAELLALVNRERNHALQQPDEASPTLTAFNEIDTSVLRDMADAASALKRQVENAIFLGAADGDCMHGPCSILQYGFGEERLSSTSKRFVKEFEGHLDITVDAQGRPLRARITQRVRGRAFVFLRFRSDVDEAWEFAEYDQRLVALRHTRRRESAGGGERGLRWYDYRMNVDGLEASSLVCEYSSDAQREAAEEPAADRPAVSRGGVKSLC